MRVRLLGTAAGGGFPQWNCRCRNCQGVRTGTIRAKVRTQSCIAVSVSADRWLLINASPDLRAQIESFPPLLPPEGEVRGSQIEGVLLTNGDLDHTLGLFLLREGKRLPVYANRPIREALCQGLRLDEVMEHYSGLEWRSAGESEPLPSADDEAAWNVSVHGFPIPGKPPRYREGAVFPAVGGSLGYAIADRKTGGRLVVMPDVAVLDQTAMAELEGCNVLLFDGTFWSHDEMVVSSTGTATATRMGHLPIGGDGGSLERLSSLPIRHKLYVHINNTNPILDEDSVERAAVGRAGFRVGEDGMELDL